MGKQRTVRLTAAELRYLGEASRILRQPVSQIVQAAIRHRAHWLGIFEGCRRRRPTVGRDRWVVLPRRRGEATERTTFSFDVGVPELLSAAAAYLGVPEHLFAVAAAVGYVEILGRSHAGLRRLGALRRRSRC